MLFCIKYCQILGFFWYAHFWSGSVTVTVCGAHPKFVRDFSGEIKQPYSGCPGYHQTQLIKNASFLTFNHDIKKPLSLGMVCRNE